MPKYKTCATCDKYKVIPCYVNDRTTLDGFAETCSRCSSEECMCKTKDVIRTLERIMQNERRSGQHARLMDRLT